MSVAGTTSWHSLLVFMVLTFGLSLARWTDSTHWRRPPTVLRRPPSIQHRRGPGAIGQYRCGRGGAPQIGSEAKQMEQLLSVEEVAEALGLAKSTVYSWSSRRRLPAIKLGTRLMFRASEVQRWIDGR